MKQYTVIFIKNNQEHTGAVMVDPLETSEEEIRSAKDIAIRLFNCEIADIILVVLA